MNYFVSPTERGRQQLLTCSSRILVKLSYALLLSLLLSPVSAQERSVTAIALFDGKSMLSIDGSRAKIMNVGDTYKDVTLIEANTEVAIIEVSGRQQTLELNGTATVSDELGSITGGGSAVVEMREGEQGFFESLGTINGRQIRFLVDTGASLVVLSSRQANAIGLDYLQGQKSFASTASGTAPMYGITLNSISVGGIRLQNVEAGVIEGNFPERPLLGMTFLSQVDMTRSGNLMTLRER